MPYSCTHMATVDVKGLTAYGVSHSRAFAGTRRSAIGRYATCALSAHLYHPGTGQWTHTVLSLTTHDALRRHASRQWSHCVMCMYATVVAAANSRTLYRVVWAPMIVVIILFSMTFNDMQCSLFYRLLSL